jgi:hypothetical protein
MINHKPHKKLHYTSGLISLLLLPVLCVLYLQKQGVFKPIFSIEFREIFHNGDIYCRTEDNRLYKTYCLSGDEVSDTKVLKLVHEQFHEFVSKKDEKNGVLVKFSNKSKLWTFIEVLNICYKEDIQLYEFYKNEFKLYYSTFKYDELVTSKQEESYEICGTGWLLIEQETPILQKLKEIPNTLKIIYISLSVLFLVMCGLETYKVSKTL